MKTAAKPRGRVMAGYSHENGTDTGVGRQLAPRGGTPESLIGHTES